MPSNVSLTGPINLAGLEQVTPAGRELLEWVKQKPTVLINLGTVFAFDETLARIMTEAIQNVLAAADLQVIWKVKKHNSFDDEFLTTAVRNSAGRLRIENWLDVEPPTLLQAGGIAAFVHHCGAGSFHDALG